MSIKVRARKAASSITWLLAIILLLKIGLMCEEEEEEEEEEEGDDAGFLSDRISEDDLHRWWQDFSALSPYPLYAIILAASSDSEIVSLSDERRRDISIMAGDSCCFVYFKDMSRAKLLTPWSYSEHAKWVYSLADVLNLPFDGLPCALFFEDLTIKGEYVALDLQDLSQDKVIKLLRELFSHLRRSEDVSLVNVRAFIRSRQAKRLARVGLKEVFDFLREILSDAIGGLLK